MFPLTVERGCTRPARGATTGASHQLSVQLTAPFFFFLATGFNFMALGKVGVILLVADVITGIVLGKNVLKMMGITKSDEGSPDWKEKLADDIMQKRAAKGKADNDQGDWEEKP